MACRRKLLYFESKERKEGKKIEQKPCDRLLWLREVAADQGHRVLSTPEMKANKEQEDGIEKKSRTKRNCVLGCYRLQLCKCSSESIRPW
jgi:hypothetical protein